MENLPHETQNEPLIGWKIINLSFQRPYWEFTSNYNGGEVNPVRDIAKCAANSSGHGKVPAENCTCGWYAYGSHKMLSGSEHGTLVKVRHYGKVIQHEFGYRSEKQDILEAWPCNNLMPHEKRELEIQFPTIKWHFPVASGIAVTGRKLDSNSDYGQGQHIHVHYPGGDPFDILPKELFSQLMPNQFFVTQLPIMMNGAYGLTLRVQTKNSSIEFELMDVNNMRIGWWSLTGTREWNKH